MPSNRRVFHRLAVGNTLIPLGVTCKTGASVFDLTGKTAKFYMVDRDGTVVVAETAADITDAANGHVQYDFQAADVATAGTYYGYFNVYGGAEPARFPVEDRDLTIVIHDDV